MSQSENSFDITGAINAETNRLLASHIGNLVISQAQAQGAANILGQELQGAHALVTDLGTQNQELKGRIQEYETDVANLQASVAELQSVAPPAIEDPAPDFHRKFDGGE